MRKYIPLLIVMSILLAGCSPSVSDDLVYVLNGKKQSDGSWYRYGSCESRGTSILVEGDMMMSSHNTDSVCRDACSEIGLMSSKLVCIEGKVMCGCKNYPPI